MMRWLRGFFSGSGDPIVKLVGALSEPEAESFRELLEYDGLPAMVKYVGALGGDGYRPAGPGDFELYVKQSDVERARELLPQLGSEAEGS